MAHRWAIRLPSPISSVKDRSGRSRSGVPPWWASPQSGSGFSSGCFAAAAAFTLLAALPITDEVLRTLRRSFAFLIWGAPAQLAGRRRKRHERVGLHHRRQGCRRCCGRLHLGWTHSVEKTNGKERWAVTAEGLVLEEARVQGSGRGMSRRQCPSPGPLVGLEARPATASRAGPSRLRATVSGWTLCDPGGLPQLRSGKAGNQSSCACDGPKP